MNIYSEAIGTKSTGTYHIWQDLTGEALMVFN